ncbi:MAG: hypothetical protein ACRDPZ_12550 [Gaiellaceae bacterium]
MRVMVIGAGLVGATVVEALHREHELNVVDLDEATAADRRAIRRRDGERERFEPQRSGRRGHSRG